jgi:kumamolisin
MSFPARVVLPGSTFEFPPDARPIGPTDPKARIEVSVMVRPRRPLDELEARLTQTKSGEKPYLSREEFAASYGADPADVAKVTAFADQAELEVVDSSLPRRTIRLAGTAADLRAAFGVDLLDYQDTRGETFRSPSGPIFVPADLGGIIQSVFGLDTRPVAHRAP